MAKPTGGAISDADPPDSPTPVPVSDLSTAFSNTERHDDGTYTESISALPINFKDGDGGWQAIDNTLVDAPGSTYAVENAANSYTVSIPANPVATPVQFETQSGAWARTKLAGGEPTDTPDVDGTQATFDDVANAASVTYQAEDSGVKESIVLSAAPTAPLSYHYSLSVSPGITPVLTSQNEIDFNDSSGATQFFMPAPNMMDSSPSEGGYSNAVSYQLSPQGSAWSLVVTPDFSWLSNAARVYPVTIDPSMDKFDQKDCWIQSDSPNANHCLDSWIWSGHAANATRRGLLDFGMSNIPSGSTINSAYLYLYLQGTLTQGNQGPTNYSLYQPSSIWTQSASWNYSGGNGAWGGGSTGATLSNSIYLGGGTTSGWVYWDATSGVRHWWNGDWQNRGFMVRSDDETHSRQLAFWSGTSNSGYHPTLRIDYTPPPVTPSVPGALSISPCSSNCGGDYQSTATLLPTLFAQSATSDGSYITYAWQVQSAQSGAVVAQGTSGGNSGTPSSWPVPSGALSASQVYQWRVQASSSATSNWSNWQYLATTVNNPPDTPSDLSFSPCPNDDCSQNVTTSLTPALQASVSDPDVDEDALTADFQVMVGSSVVASGSADGGYPYFTVPVGVLKSGSSFMFRVGANDGQAETWSGWVTVSVQVPTGAAEPQVALASPCAGNCSSWDTSSATPTFAATNSSSNPTSNISFEVASDVNSLISTVSGVAPGATASWTVPAGTLGTANYMARAGTVTPQGTVWTRWQPFAVADANSQPDTASLNVAPGHVDNSSRDPARNSDDSGAVSTYGFSNLSQLDQQIDNGDAAAAAAGYSADSPQAQSYSVPIWQKYAPVGYIHPGDLDNPLSAHTFINNSDLRWSHDAPCASDDDLTPNSAPSESAMGSGGYTDQVKSGILCHKSGTVWKSTDPVRPHGKGGPSGGGEGMFLDLHNSYRTGSIFTGREPVYVDYTAYQDIEYWFLWGENYIPASLPGAGGRLPGIDKHEGDWEHITIGLNSLNKPYVVAFGYHGTGCSIPWTDFQTYSFLYYDHKHPVVEFGEGSHGAHPYHALPPSIDHHTDEVSDQGPIWFAENNLQLVTDPSNAWFGYDGGWGEVGSRGDLTGPEGASPAKDAANTKVAYDYCTYTN